MKRLIALVLLSAAVLAGCATLDERQRGWIFQPSDRSWWRGEEAGDFVGGVAWQGFVAVGVAQDQAGGGGGEMADRGGRD